jgi:O-antigen/teichoic acid export membrane protein
MDLVSLKRKLAMGSLAGLLRVVLAVPLYLLLTPFMLHELGPEMFGLWSFSTLIISVMTLTDFGFKNALVYHVAQSNDRPNEINGHFNVAFWTYLVMAALILGVTAVFGSFIVRDVLAVPQRLATEASFILWVTALSFGIRFVAIPYQAVVEGNQEHAVSQFILLAWLIVYFVGTLLALAMYHNIYALGAVNVLANMVVLGAFVWRISTHYTHIRLGVRFLRRHAFLSMLKFGSGIQLATLMIAAREPMLKVMISRVYDLTSVATFEVVYRLCTQLVSVVATPLLGSFSASALLATHREHELQNILRPMLGFCLAVFVPAVLFFGTFSGVIVKYWLGEGYVHVGEVLPVAFAAFAVYYTSQPLYSALEGAGMSGYSAAVQLVSVSVTFVTFSLLVKYQDYAAPYALLSGFFVFSASNYFVFKWRFKSMCLFTLRQALWLLGPALAFCVSYRMIPREGLPAAFALYSMVHMWCMRESNIFDLIGVTRRLAKLARVGV